VWKNVQIHYSVSQICLLTSSVNISDPNVVNPNSFLIGGNDEGRGHERDSEAGRPSQWELWICGSGQCGSSQFGTTLQGCRSGQISTMWQGWTLQEWTMWHDVEGVDNAGVDNAGVLKCLWQMCLRQVESHQQYVRSNRMWYQLTVVNFVLNGLCATPENVYSKALSTLSQKVRQSQKSDTVAQKCDCRRKRRYNGEIRRLSHKSATVSLLCDSRTFLRQCGQALTRRSIEGKHDGDRFERLLYEWRVWMPVYNDGWRLRIRIPTPFWAISISGSLNLIFYALVEIML